MRKILKILTSSILIIFIFNISISNAMSAQSTPLYKGIDVSNWQKNVDYKKVKDAGVEIVYMKASQGQRSKDKSFETNYKNAKANGLKVGFYHYVNATSVDSAEKEAEFFCSVISGKDPDCKLVMDYEEFGGVSKTQINRIAEAFLTKVKQITGKEVIVYSNLYNSRNTFSKELAGKYQLWLAYYASENAMRNATSNWENWIGWQYTDEGRLNGVSGYVDKDYFTKEIFLDSTSTLPEVEDVPDTPTNSYIVKRGDTLWAIARKYGVSIEEIVNENQIQNPNLIYPGQILKIPTIQNNEDDCTMNHIIYTIRRGDTLTAISAKFGVSINYIAELNNIQNINLIYAGRQLLIPRCETGSEPSDNENVYIVKRGDTLWGISRKFGVSVRYLVNKNGIKNERLIYPGQVIKY